jgi:hypothetical protein
MEDVPADELFFIWRHKTPFHRVNLYIRAEVDYIAKHEICVEMTG